MKSKFLSVIMLGAAGVFLAGCPGETTKKAVGKVTETVVENVKGAASGVSEGFDSGRKQVTSPDGAIILSNAAEMEGKVGVEILKVEPGERGFSVVIGFSNATEQNYRITNLTADSIMSLDKSGYVTRAYILTPQDVTVPASAKDKLIVWFEGEAKDVAKMRLFGKEYPLPEAK